MVLAEGEHHAEGRAFGEADPLLQVTAQGVADVHKAGAEGWSTTHTGPKGRAQRARSASAGVEGP